MTDIRQPMKIILAEGKIEIGDKLLIWGIGKSLAIDFENKYILEGLEDFHGKQVKLILEVQNDK